ncbi:MAG: hypothetical protein OXP09_05960 [Gammaproteobacteria bacterium]|nr:hypothetical protein [Gammaproteobacteria bacterium]MDE0365104.1 hypothetical protein [Gammaproteobacteria bacterium]
MPAVLAQPAGALARWGLPRLRKAVPGAELQAVEIDRLRKALRKEAPARLAKGGN